MSATLPVIPLSPAYSSSISLTSLASIEYIVRILCTTLRVDTIEKAMFGKSLLSSITLDNVLSGETCDPISLTDFESYLEFKEYSLELLQFVVWFQDYRRRFFDLPQSVQALSPGLYSNHFQFGIPCPARAARRIEVSERNFSCVPSHTGTACSQEATGECSSPPLLVPLSPTLSELYSYADSLPISQPASPLLSEQFHKSITPIPRPADQPFRAECACIVATFFRPGAPKELVLDSRARDAIVRDLTWNTHPDVFLPAYEEAYDTLAMQSLPRFLKLASTNINTPKIFYWLFVACLNLSIAFFIALMTIMLVKIGDHEQKRAWRLFAIPNATMGGMQLYSAYKGFCSEVWGRGHAQLRPWELEIHADSLPSSLSSSSSDVSDMEKAGVNLNQPSSDSSLASLKSSPPETLGSSTWNSSILNKNNSEAIAPFSGSLTKEDVDAVVIAPFASFDQSSITAVKKMPPALSSSLSRRHPRKPPPPMLILDLSSTFQSLDLDTSELGSPIHPTPTPPLVHAAGSPIHPTQTLPLIHTAGSTNNDMDNDQDRAAYHENSSSQSSQALQNTNAGYPSKRPPVFGPERVVLDPRIRAVHKQVMSDMLKIGTAWTLFWTVLVVGMPGLH